MTKRLLDFAGKDFLNVALLELKQSILASEGRIIMAENVPTEQPYLNSLTNAEIERAAGADLILFNVLDLIEPEIKGIPSNIPQSEHIKWIHNAICRPIGINLEPIDKKATMNQERHEISIGRIVSPKTLKLADEYGFSFICLTGNPGTGVSNLAIKDSIEMLENILKG